MCERFYLLEDDQSYALATALSVAPQSMRYASDIAPGATISFVHSEGEQRCINTGAWWLYLDRETLKPNYQCASFNSSSDNFHEKNSLTYYPYRQSRCIIPASAFIEGRGDNKTYHKINFVDQAIAFGGLYKAYIGKDSKDIIYSVSIITVPFLSEWNAVRSKSIPLMLPVENKNLIEQWLDPASDINQFEPCFNSSIQARQQVTPIGIPRQWNEIGESFLLDISSNKLGVA